MHSTISRLIKWYRESSLNKLLYGGLVRGARASAPGPGMPLDEVRRVMDAYHEKPAGAGGGAPSFLYPASLELSIILPAYNVVDFIGPCLESIERQDLSFPFELIIVNDGSTDGTEEAVKRFAEERDWVVLINQENAGLSAARNRGIEMARGRLLTFVDSDDMLEPGYLGALCRDIGDADYISSLWSWIDEDGLHKRLGETRRTYGAPWGRVFRREVWSDVRFPVGYYYEDTVLAYLVEGSFKEVSSDLSGYLYRLRRSSINSTGASSPKALDTYWILEYLLDECRRLGVPFDDRLYRRTVFQMGRIMYRRLRNAPPEVQLAAFTASCHLIRSSFGEGRRGICEGRDRDIETALYTDNYRLWRFAARWV